MSERDECRVCGLPLAGHSATAVKLCLAEARAAEAQR
jgi:hypothetical protein